MATIKNGRKIGREGPQMIATISTLMAIPDAIYLPYERNDAHTTGPRMVRTRPHGYRIDRSRIVKTIRREVVA